MAKKIEKEEVGKLVSADGSRSYPVMELSSDGALLLSGEHGAEFRSSIRAAIRSRYTLEWADEYLRHAWKTAVSALDNQQSESLETVEENT